MKISLLLVSFLGFLCGHAEAGNVVVRDVEQFEKHIPRMTPGDTIFLRSDEDKWSDVNLVFEGEGEPGNPIVLAAQRPGQTVLTGSSRLRILGKHLVVTGLVFKNGSLAGGSVIAVGSGRGATAQDCRLTGTAITDYNPDDRNVNYKWVSVYGSRNRVDHCFFKGQNHTGQALVVWLGSEANEHRIDHNYFAGRPILGWNGGETVRIGTSARSMQNSKTVVEDNLFENCDGEAEIISIKSCENVIRRNAFLSSAGAVTLRHGNRNRGEANWFLGKGKARSGGVRVIGEDQIVVNNHFEGLTGRGNRATISVMNGVPDAELHSYWPVRGGLIAHNTIVDCASPFDIGFGAGGRGRTLAPKGVVIAGNLVISDTTKGIVVRDSSSGVKWIENIWAGDLEGDVEGFEAREISFHKVGDLSIPVGHEPLILSTEVDNIRVDINGRKRTGKKIAGSHVSAEDGAEHVRPTKRTVGPKWMN